MIKHILLIPAEGDPHGLLREGPCGARPPTYSGPECGPGERCTVCHGSTLVAAGEYETATCTACQHGRIYPRALVLVWDGEVVREGYHRMRDCCFEVDIRWVKFGGDPLDIILADTCQAGRILGGETVVVED